MNLEKASRAFIVAALVALVALVTAAVLFVTGDAAMERLALLIAFAGTIVPILAAALRADQAARATNETSTIAQALNGGFEARVRHANRITASETGSVQDEIRANADATVAAALSHGDPIPPEVMPVLAAAGTGVPTPAAPRVDEP